MRFKFIVTARSRGRRRASAAAAAGAIAAAAATPNQSESSFQNHSNMSHAPHADALVANLATIFSTLPAVVVREAARGRDQRAAVEVLMLVSKLPSDIIGQCVAVAGADHAQALRLLISIASGEVDGGMDDEDDEDADDESASNAGGARTEQSIITLLNERNEPSSCGYCHNKQNSSRSYGMVCSQLTVADYQALVDRGWRRSGTYLYRPDKTCCPLYTIRLDTRKFRASKAQKSALRRWQRYLAGEELQRTPADESMNVKASVSTDASSSSSSSSSSSTTSASASSSSSSSSTTCASSSSSTSFAGSPAARHAASLVASLLTSALAATAADASTPDAARACANEALAAADAGALTLKGESDGGNDSVCVRLASTAALKWAARALPAESALLPAASRAERDAAKAARRQAAAALSAKIAHAVCAHSTALHTAAASDACTICAEAAGAGFLNFTVTVPIAVAPAAQSKCDVPLPAAPLAAATSVASSAPALTPRRLDVSLQPAAFDQEAFDLYVKYQVRVHGDQRDELKPKSYARFLCDSPLVTSRDGALGSFHQHYRVDGRLIAVGVIDILPACLSSVYVFYDPDLDFLSPGVVTALLEIEHTRHLAATHEALQYYYMGFYCHSCPKMRYKGAYEPSDVLCPARMTWHTLAECVPLLEQQKFVEFSDTVPVVDASSSSSSSSSASSTSPSSSTASSLSSLSLPPKLSITEHGGAWLPTAAFRANDQAVQWSQLPARMQRALAGTGNTYAALVGPELVRRMWIKLN